MPLPADAGKSLESWIWDAACSIRGAKDAPKYKEFILPLIFAKRLCDVFDEELNRIAKEVGSRAKAFRLVQHDKKLVHFFLPLQPGNPDDAVWSVIRTLSKKIGEQLTTHLRAVADANPLLKGISDRIDFNATTHGHRRGEMAEWLKAHAWKACRTSLGPPKRAAYRMAATVRRPACRSTWATTWTAFATASRVCSSGRPMFEASTQCASRIVACSAEFA